MNDIRDYVPEGTKDCEYNCDREVIMTAKGPIIVCHFCKRVVRELKK